MSLANASINQESEEDALSSEVQSEVSPEFFEGIQDVELADLNDIPLPMANVDSQMNRFDEPEDFKSLLNKKTDIIDSDETIFDKANDISTSEFNRSLDIAIQAGLEERVADTLRNLCENGLAMRQALVLASYSLQGLDIKEISNLALLYLAKRSEAEISGIAGQMLSKPNISYGDRQGSFSKETENGESAFEAGERIGQALKSAISSTKSITSGFIQRLREGNEEIESPIEQDVTLIQSENDDFEEKCIDAIAKYKSAPDQDKKMAKEELESVLNSFKESALKKLGSAKSLSDATSIMEQLKSSKGKILNKLEEVFPGLEMSGFKELFKALDTQLKKMLVVIKSKFKAEDKLAELSENSVSQESSPN